MEMKNKLINKYLVPSDRVKIVSAPQKIDMGEKDPIGEIRRNKETSLVKAFQAVKDKTCDGVVTAGPTQGTIVAAHLIIRRIKGMKRVALCPTLPKPAKSSSNNSLTVYFPGSCVSKNLCI